MASPPSIAIIGAGPAGLTLARILHVSECKIDITVYERDASPSARSDQGGTLDLHTDTGLAALRKGGLWNSFRKYARYDGQEMIIADKNATALIHVGGGEKKGLLDRPEIDRHRLQEILLQSVPEEFVRWDRRLKEVTGDGMLRFEGREKLEGPFDLIVGADGAWSKVRGKVTELKPAYSGVSGYEMEIREPAKQCPHVDQMVGRGSLFTSSDGKFLNAQRMGDDSLKVRSWYLCPEGEAQETMDKFGRKETLRKIFERYTDWAPETTELLRQADVDSMKVWTCYELPVGCRWEHQQGFTLIGDAASLMTPFSGEGVNKAMKDSLDLAELIEKSLNSNNDLTLDHAVLLYEQSMFPRAQKVQARTMCSKQNAFGPDAPISTMT
ncbi:MAG: hypothetical protein M4579_002520, partial [Chaenotheca gracillima]